MTACQHPVVTVIGSGSQDYPQLARPLGELLARLDVHLLTGGGQGVMAAVSESFANSPRRRGLVIGILPCRENDPTSPKPGYPNPWVELCIPTHLPLSGKRGIEAMSRNHINVLTANAIVALPGGAGTGSEVLLAIRYQKPVVAFFDTADQIAGLSPTVPIVRTLDEVERFLRASLQTA